jgi:hypothetical protein
MLRVMSGTRIDFNIGPGGWVQAFGRPELDRPLEPHETVWIRLRSTGAGTWEPTGELYLPGITPEGLRLVPLRRILLAIGADPVLRTRLAARYEEPIPAVGSIEFLGSFNGYVRAECALQLERPRGRYLSHEFYASVAETYRGAVERGLKPRKAIADAAGVSNEVAGKWVREARKRDLLPPTAPGKVSA